MEVYDNYMLNIYKRKILKMKFLNFVGVIITFVTMVRTKGMQIHVDFMLHNGTTKMLKFLM